MHRSILFYLHLLISGLHHHFSIQRHHPPLAGIPFKSTITAYGNTDIPVTGRHNDAISPFQPPLHPHPERKDIFYFLQPLPPFLFLILLPFPLYALRTPPGFLPQTFHHGGKIRFARLRYSADQKWTSASVDTTYVRADTVSMNSPLPIKKRDSLAHASGTLPKQGISRVMEESDINTINIMKAQGAKWTQIASKLTEDPLFCSIGLDESNEANFLTALCEGVVAVEDLTNVGTALRVNFGYLPKNGFGVTTPGEITLDDIERVLAAADGDGNSISVICIALSTYKKLRQTQGAKELAATYRGQIFDSDTSLPTPTSSLFDEAFADQYNGVRFLKIDRSIIYEKNGVRKAYKPWNANRLVYLTTENVGSLVWGTLAEKTSPVEGVVYTTVDEMKLISRFRTANPLVETTAGQMLALTVIEGVDQIYYQDITDAQTVDAEKEAQDSTDVKVTIWGDTYKKTEFVQELNKITGGKLTAKSADEKIIARVNELNDEDEATLKATVESHKSE